MFTFLRISSQQANKINRQPPATSNSSPQPVKPYQPSEATPLNPWEKELYRLAARPDGKPSQYSNKVFGSQLPKPRQSEGKAQSKQGTLTDLKIWWDKSMALASKDGMDLTTFAPPPAKKRNHWCQ